MIVERNVPDKAISLHDHGRCPVCPGGGRVLVVSSLSVPDTVKVLEEHEWPMLREARLAALRDSPDAFLSTFERERRYDEKRWRSEFSRGEWTVMLTEDRTIGLLGATRYLSGPRDERYLEYMWVSSEFRRSGRASELMKTVMRRLGDSGVVTVWLWVLDGNDAARRLYEGLDFVYTGTRQRLRGDPPRYEEEMKAAIWRSAGRDL